VCNIPLAVFGGKTDDPNFNAFFVPCPYRKCSVRGFHICRHCDRCIVSRHVGWIPHTESMLGKESTKDMLREQNVSPCYFQFVVQAGLLRSKISTEMGCHRRSCHFTPRSLRTYVPLHFFFWKYIKSVVYVTPLPTNLPEIAGGYKLVRLQLHGLAYKCVDWTPVHIWYVPSYSWCPHWHPVNR